MHRAALALLLLAASLGAAPPATAACAADGLACWDEHAAGDCDGYGYGWDDEQVRAAPLGVPVRAHRHAWYTCTGGEHRTDTWHHNATVGDAADVRTTWASHPATGWSSLTLHARGPDTNQTTTWYALRGGCEFWAYGTLLGARLNDRLPCAAPPPSVPVPPWRGLLP